MDKDVFWGRSICGQGDVGGRTGKSVNQSDQSPVSQKYLQVKFILRTFVVASLNLQAVSLHVFCIKCLFSPHTVGGSMHL